MRGSDSSGRSLREARRATPVLALGPEKQSIPCAEDGHVRLCPPRNAIGPRRMATPHQSSQ
jgi:hypothetical protein